MTRPSSQNASREKNRAASSSVIAAIGLTFFKLVVGLMTNSLGILAEAAHSGLDLVAAIMTLIAVRLSGKPSDMGHQFGHGKIENLSALFETLLLLLTSAWIIYEAAQRLLVSSSKVDVSLWAFVVMFASIVTDYSRSRVLYKAARKHNSQALEADALHFRTDIWSSSVVILGLILVRLAENLPQISWLVNADSFAALVVAIIVIYVSLQLGRRTVQGLLDSAPVGLREQIKRDVEQIPGVRSCHRIRIRVSGPKLFCDLHVSADPHLSLEEGHALAGEVEKVVKALASAADVTTHIEPKR